MKSVMLISVKPNMIKCEIGADIPHDAKRWSRYSHPECEFWIVGKPKRDTPQLAHAVMVCLQDAGIRCGTLRRVK